MDDGHLDDSDPASPSSPSARLPLDVRPARDHQISEEAGGGCRGSRFLEKLGILSQPRGGGAAIPKFL